MHQVFCSPARYIQGPDATLILGPEMVKLGVGGKTLVIASASAKKLLAAHWKETFAKADIEYSVEAFAGECSRREIDRIVKRALELKAQVIVGAGGGKVLDAARAVALALKKKAGGEFEVAGNGACLSPDELALAEQLIDLVFAGAVEHGEPLEGTLLIGGVVIDVRLGISL